jgi:phospholipid/cholesterol/gamma-HCH transport system substrate-binding protein
MASNAPSGGSGRTLAIAALLIAGVIALAVELASGGGSDGHSLTVTVPDAVNVVSGQYVKDSGVNVGEVDSLTAVDHGHAARLKLTLSNDVWPLPRGSRMVLHWGGTVSFANRYILLIRGPAGNPPMATDGVLPSSAFSVPVEFDSLLDTFTAPVRSSLKQFLDNSGVTLRAASGPLRSALRAAPPALTQASDVLGDVDANETALRQLVHQGAQVVGAINRAQPGIGSLVQNAGTTFAALATRTRQLDSTLATAPSTLRQARVTLASAEPTLNLAGSVTGRVAPGVRQVQRIAAPLASLLVTLRDVGPDAVSALSQARRATASLNPLLVKATAVMPQLGSIGSQSVTSLQCVRPYTPDIVAFASDWGDFISGVDGHDHYFRAQVQTLVPAPTNAMPYDSAQMKKLLPWISYVFPPPPGYAAGQPWLLSQCNEGPNTLNPNDDPENDATAPELPAANAKPISLPEGSVP